jgi:DNA-binding response OmpR family regulator
VIRREEGIMTTHTILIVEDTIDIANMMQTILEGAGYSTVHMPDGMAALEWLSEQTPDMMLLDIGLPGMSGWEVLERLKAVWNPIPFPIVIMTAFADPANKLIGKLQDAVIRYMTKPFETVELMSAVREALSPPDSSTTAPNG